MTSDHTWQSMSDSLTGYEEIKIQERFGVSVSELLEGAATTLFRGLRYVEVIREGATPDDAYKQVMDLTIKQVVELFTPDPEEVDEEEPETPLGDDSSPAA